MEQSWTLVFTSYLIQEKAWQEDKDGYKMWEGENPISDSWFPSIYFYDLMQRKVRDCIYGAEIFVKAELGTVQFVANDYFAEKET